MARRSIMIIGAGIAGLSAAAISGRRLVKKLCKEDRKRFLTD
jgi:thioredoxin reductase